jgi:hypothetical protein
MFLNKTTAGSFHAKAADRWRRQNWDSIHFWGLGNDGPKKVILKFSELSLQ